MSEQPLERGRHPRGIERFHEEARVPDLPSAAAPHEAAQLLMCRPPVPRRLLLQRTEGAQVAVLFDDPQHGLDAQRADQLVLEIDVADIEAVVEDAPERRCFARVAETGHLHARAEAFDEARDGMGTADRDDGDALGVEIAPSPLGECADRDLVARPLDEDDGMGLALVHIPYLADPVAPRTKAPPATEFAKTVADAYATAGAAVELGTGVYDGELVRGADTRLPLKTMNRHGLIAGATGTGKTRSLQLIAEQLSAAGVAVFAADVKGDVSGISTPGETGGPAEKRAAELGLSFTPTGYPVEYVALGGIGPGVPVRATVSDFGPQLLAKVLESNETQEQSLALVFHYADTKGLPLLDLSDLRALLTFLDSDAGKSELEGIGGLAPQTVGVLLRALLGLEDGGGNELFGEPQFDVNDLLRTAPDGRGIITCLELPAVQDKPRLFSTALMWLLAELFETLPEVGDLDKPKLCFFFDEAHLLFDGASKAFIESVTQTVRLIRSKGVGVFFITQTPKDIHEDVLAQLGNRVQHALRAFTPDDATALRAAVRTFPKSDFYDLEELLQQLGIGEAAVTILSESGVPTPVVHTKLRPPLGRMAPADNVDAAARASPLYAKYGTRMDAQSAREMLAARLDQPTATQPTEKHKEAARASRGGDSLGDFLNSRAGKQIQREVIRGVFGMLRKRL